MPKVKFTANLKRFYPDLTVQEVDVCELQEILSVLNNRFPGIKDYVVDEQGSVRKHVNIFIGNELIKDRVTLTDSIEEQDEIYIMQALSGG